MQVQKAFLETDEPLSSKKEILAGDCLQTQTAALPWVSSLSKPYRFWTCLSPPSHEPIS